MEQATLGNGCFWCTEAVFKRIKGVSSVVSGYAGGLGSQPTYEQVSSGTTGFAESVQLEFDPTTISYDRILDVFWAVHDPTQLNRQGNDVGSQYRSVIFYHTDEQKRIAEQSRQQLADSGKYTDPIVTTIEPFTNFYPAENHHQNFYDQNRNYPYCKVIIDPKVQKLLKEFSEIVKP